MLTRMSARQGAQRRVPVPVRVRVRVRVPALVLALALVPVPELPTAPVRELGLARRLGNQSPMR